MMHPMTQPTSTGASGAIVRRALLGAGLSLAFGLGGCQSYATMAPPPVQGPVAPAAEAPAPAAAAPAAPVASGLKASGTAELAGTPFAGAALRVFKFGTAAPLAQGTTDERGGFDLALPALVPGTPLLIVATRDGRALSALATAGAAPAGYRVKGTEGVSLSFASSLVLQLLQARLDAFAEVTDDGPSAESAALVAAVESLTAYVRPHEQALLASSGGSSLTASLNASGGGTLTDAGARAFFATLADASARVSATVRELNGLIVTTMTRTKKTPSQTHTGLLVVGGQTFDAVPGASRSGSSGGTGSPGTPSSVTVSGWFGQATFGGITPAASVGQDVSVSPFKPAADMPAYEGERTATAVGDGTFVIVGGTGGVDYGESGEGEPWANSLEVGLYIPVAEAALVVHGDYVYRVGGLEAGTTPLATVTRTLRDGSTGFSAESVSPLTQPRVGARCVVLGDRLYVIGGRMNGVATDSVEVATFQEDGSLGAFAPADTHLTTDREGAACVVTQAQGRDRWVYMLGGKDHTGVLSSVEAAPIDENGQVGAFAATSLSLVDPAAPDVSRARWGLQGAQIGGAVYVFGGYTDAADRSLVTGVTDWADVNPVTGTLSVLHPYNATMTYPRGGYGLAVSGDWVVLAGGSEGTALPSEVARIRRGVIVP